MPKRISFSPMPRGSGPAGTLAVGAVAAFATIGDAPETDLLLPRGTLVEELRIEADSPYITALQQTWNDALMSAIHHLPAMSPGVRERLLNPTDD